MNFSFLLDLIFPPRCLNCEARTPTHAVICEACFALIPLHTSLFCGKCEARLPLNKKICHPEFPYLLGAATDYHHEAVKSLVTGKLRSVARAAEPLAELLIRYVGELSLDLSSFAVLPVPLAPRRERQRGFNQSHLIAMRFAAHYRLPLTLGYLVRTRDTPPQRELKDRTERYANVRGCFAVVNAKVPALKNFVVVDDVTTSHATFFEAARVLKGAGVKKIICLAVAKGSAVQL